MNRMKNKNPIGTFPRDYGVLFNVYSAEEVTYY